MTKDFIEKFHLVSISGRYIYGYLCLLNTIQIKKADRIPAYLDNILCEFVSSNRLNQWENFADELLPSIILDEKNDEAYYEYISTKHVSLIREYYKSQPSIIKDLIGEIIWLGLSNLYGGFDTDISFVYIKEIINLMQQEKIDLPDFSIIQNCSVMEKHGWGERTNMSKFIDEIYWH